MPTRTLISIFVIILSLQDLGLAETQGRFARQLIRDPQQTYIVKVPKTYDSTRKYPLFIAIHWNTGSAQEQVDQWHKYTNRDQYILLCPQFSYGYQWLKGGEDIALGQILVELNKEFPYDKQRIYLVGSSGGAQFVHRFAFKHPNVITAACVIAAGSYSPPPNTAQARRVKFYVTVGGRDTERLGITKQFYQQLKANGYDAEFQLFPDVGHVLDIDMKQAVTKYLQRVSEDISDLPG